MSPKNKGKFGKAKSSVEPDDQFVSTMGDLGARLQPHVVKISVSVGVVLVLLLAFFSYRWWNLRQEAHATDLYQQALQTSRALILPEPPVEPAVEGEEEGQPVPVIKDEDQDGIPDSFPSAAARAEAALTHLEALRAGHGSTDVAREATLLHALMLYDAARYAAARDMYAAYIAGGATRDLMRVAQEGMAYAQEALALSMDDPAARTVELEKVLDMFRAIQTSDEGPDRDRALYHEARILAALGKRDEAIAALTRAQEIAPRSKLSQDIGERLAQLKAGQ